MNEVILNHDDILDIIIDYIKNDVMRRRRNQFNYSDFIITIPILGVDDRFSCSNKEGSIYSIKDNYIGHKLNFIFDKYDNLNFDRTIFTIDYKIKDEVISSIKIYVKEVEDIWSY